MSSTSLLRKMFLPILLLPILLLVVANASTSSTSCLYDDDDVESSGGSSIIQVRPSAVSPGVVVPNAMARGREYEGDVEHLVIGDPGDKEPSSSTLIVLVPGTTSRPDRHSCLLRSLRRSSSSSSVVIGLSYRWLNEWDGRRNEKCASLDSAEKQVECLSKQHEDAAFGGSYGASHDFWHEVSPRDSITGRLGLLLQWLDEERGRDAGWHRFYHRSVDEDDLPTPIWDRLIVVGHSQGAGHAAWLSRAVALKGSVTISGPQDRCVGCDPSTRFWVDDSDFRTRRRTALVHANETAYSTIVDNWRRMTAAGASTWTRDGEVADVGFAVGDALDDLDLCRAPLATTIRPASTSTCTDFFKMHCSTAVDDSAPFVERTNGDKLRLYDLNVWPRLVESVVNCGQDVGRDVRRAGHGRRREVGVGSSSFLATLLVVGVVVVGALLRRSYREHAVGTEGKTRSNAEYGMVVSSSAASLIRSPSSSSSSSDGGARDDTLDSTAETGTGRVSYGIVF